MNWGEMAVTILVIAGIGVVVLGLIVIGVVLKTPVNPELDHWHDPENWR